MSADTIQASMSEGQGSLVKNPEEGSVAAFLLFITIVLQKEKI